MPVPIIHNEKLAARTNRGELEFVWTATAPSHGKDDDHAHLHHDGARVHR